MTESESDEDQKTLGRRLKEAREYLNLSQQFVTASTGIPRTAISEIERGQRRVDSLELRKLARVYRMPVSHFLGDEAGPVETTAVLGRVLQDLPTEDQREVLTFAQFLTARRSRKS
jgi:transcriptional regulator with XRE-family HTH domain